MTEYLYERDAEINPMEMVNNVQLSLHHHAAPAPSNPFEDEEKKKELPE